MKPRVIPPRVLDLRHHFPVWALAVLLFLVAALGASAQSISLSKSVLSTNGAAAPDPIPAGLEFDYVMSYTFSQIGG